MSRQANIIIVEKDIPMAAKLSLQLDSLGYNITGIFSRAKDALHYLEQEIPDLILLDDQLKGQLNGIEALDSKIQHSSPIIYFNRFTAEKINKILPKRLLRKRAALKKSSEKPDKSTKEDYQLSNDHQILNDRIFVRHCDKMVKISLDDILYFEADRNYCKVFSKERQYLLVTTLKEVDAKLTDKRFLRIHRSYIANLSHIDEIGGNHVVIHSHSLPLSKNLRPELFKYLQVI